MDLTTYRLDQAEKRAEISDARMERIEAQLTQIQVALAGLATKDSIRNWGEPPRDSRRLFDLSYAAMGMFSCIA
jgi:hypothetical protein